MGKDYEFAKLLDFYGKMLTDKQRNFLSHYYFDDLSLSEIAQNEGITRQGVRDAIKRAEGQLANMETQLGHVKKFDRINKALDDILECTDNINNYNLRYGLSREINDTVVKIKFIIQTLNEE
ncbi:MAG: sigma factor-like helix-turn-helix DNA-binding protein [Clostridia bacterium]|nr:sigma factor-like helix-turn-helix DNA-binding protein [Clostridia bacterium]